MQKKFLLRIGPELWDELERWARDDLRSVNGQIEYLLREAVSRRRRRQPAGPLPPAAPPPDGDPQDDSSGPRR